MHKIWHRESKWRAQPNSRSCSWVFAGRMSLSLKATENTYSEGIVGNLLVGLVFKERCSSLVSLSWVSTVCTRSCTSFNGSRLKCCSVLVLTLKLTTMLTLCWHYVDIDSALLLHCSDVDCAVTLAERWCQRWHCLDVDDAPPVKLIVLSGAGLSNSGASPAPPWAQSSMTKRYELWNTYI